MRFLANFDDIAFFAAIRRDIDPGAIDLDVAMGDELARGKYGGHEFGAINHGIKTALQQADEIFGGIAFHAVSSGIDALELFLGDIAVIALELLLGAQLNTKIGKLAATTALAVHAGAIFFAIDRALGATPDVFAHTAVNFIFGSNSFCHGFACPFDDCAKFMG